MKSNSITITTLIIVILSTVLISCARKWTYSSAKQINQNKFRDEEMVDEVMFVMEMKSASILSRNLANFARDSAYSVMVSSFADHLYNSYILLDAEISLLATKAGIKISDQMNTEDWSAYHKAKGLSKADFDREYIIIMKDTHEKFWKSCEQFATTAKNNAIRSFAARKIDFFGQNYERSNDLVGKIVSLK